VESAAGFISILESSIQRVDAEDNRGRIKKDNKMIGLGAMRQESMRADIDAAKSQTLLSLITRRHQGPLERILVVGCGAGHEAGILARSLGAATFGIDIGTEFAFDHEGSRPAKLIVMDAQRLGFDSSSFDLVYSFHALEHIPDCQKALSEMNRVLRPGGTFCIGTPNRARLVGYLGSSASLREKVLWNLQDLSCRLRGRWSNEEGAHAGFYVDELRLLCSSHFGSAEEITDSYYAALYERHRKLLEWIVSTGMKYRVFPCVYIAGSKGEPVLSP